MQGTRTRDVWVDNVKAFACILVALGHFFQSIRPELIPLDNWFAGWFDKTIYFFHVPLFFLCSGYVYQKYSRVDSIKAYFANIKKKVVMLGMPYVMFTTITWMLKTIFSGTVSNQINGLGSTLFVSPTSPYWYLYALFFIFAVTPTVRHKRGGVIAFGISLVAYGVGFEFGRNVPKCIQYILLNEVWFVLGMNLCLSEFTKKEYPTRYCLMGAALGVLFILFSIWVFDSNVQHAAVDWLMGILGCGATILIVHGVFRKRKNSTSVWFAKWTMPVFLMHTIFAAPVRIVLLKLRVDNLALHIILGLLASFAGPIVAAKISEKYKWIDAWIYPGKYIRF